MKKIFIVLLFLSVFTLNVQAKDYTSYCIDKSASKTLTGTLASAVGVNAVKRNVIESEIASALKKETGAKFDVKVASFYGANVTSGAFKGLSLKGENLLWKGLYITNLTADTICSYNEVKYENDTLGFVENSVMEFSATLTEDDLKKAMAQNKYGKMMEQLNQDKAFSSLMKIESQDIKIKDDKLVFEYEVSLLKNLNHLPLKLPNLNLSFSSGLAVKDGEIQLLDFGLNNKNVKYDFLLPFINKFNPTSWNITENNDFIKNAKVEINDVQIKDSKIEIKGAIIALKSES